MILYELLEVINDSTFVKIYDGEQNYIASYDGKESIPESFNEFEINDIFNDEYQFSNKIVNAIGIELEMYKLDYRGEDDD